MSCITGAHQRLGPRPADNSSRLVECNAKIGAGRRCLFAVRHAVHNAPMKRVLWNAPLAENGQDFMERVCFGCHQPDGAGAQKIITSGSHPLRLYFGYRKSYRDIDIDKEGGPQSKPIPLYSNTGERTDTGEISCPTCHDSHVWSAREKAAGGGKNTGRDNRRQLSEGGCKKRSVLCLPWLDHAHVV